MHLPILTWPSGRRVTLILTKLPYEFTVHIHSRQFTHTNTPNVNRTAFSPNARQVFGALPALIFPLSSPPSYNFHSPHNTFKFVLFFFVAIPASTSKKLSIASFYQFWLLLAWSSFISYQLPLFSSLFNLFVQRRLSSKRLRCNVFVNWTHHRCQRQVTCSVLADLTLNSAVFKALSFASIWWQSHFWDRSLAVILTCSARLSRSSWVALIGHLSFLPIHLPTKQ